MFGSQHCNFSIKVACWQFLAICSCCCQQVLTITRSQTPANPVSTSVFGKHFTDNVLTPLCSLASPVRLEITGWSTLYYCALYNNYPLLIFEMKETSSGFLTDVSKVYNLVGELHSPLNTHMGWTRQPLSSLPIQIVLWYAGETGFSLEHGKISVHHLKIEKNSTSRNAMAQAAPLHCQGTFSCTYLCLVQT